MASPIDSATNSTVTSGDRGVDSVKPPPLKKFTGAADNFAKFHRSFMLLALASNWNDLDKARNFPLYLGDTILDLIETNGINMYRPTRDTFNLMVELLNNTYRPITSSALSLQSFYSSTWDNVTPFAEFCFGVNNLLRKALPSIDEDTARTLVMDQCTKSLPEYIKRIIVASKPQALPELIQSVEEQLNIPNHTAAASYGERKSKYKKRSCKKCGSNNHSTKECKGFAICKTCHKRGHLSYICNSKHTNNINCINFNESVSDEANYSCFVSSAQFDLSKNFTIPIEIGTRVATALIDTGSSISIIRHGFDVEMHPDKISLTSAGGKQMEPIGTSIVEFSLNGKVFKWKPNTKKCIYKVTSIKYLGFVISKDGITPDPDRIKSVADIPIPNTPKRLQSFIGFANYYRDLIPNFASIAQPLYNAISTKPFELSTEAINRISNIKHLLTSSPLLSLPNLNKNFTISTDASDTAIASVLYQEVNGKKHVIRYASRILNKSEINYSTFEKEALALVHALKTFHQYVYGKRTKVWTDHNPLTHLKTIKDSHGRISRWLLFLQNYDLEIVYKRGPDNVDADFLSRTPCESNAISVHFLSLPVDKWISAQKEDITISSIAKSIEQNKYKGKRVYRFKDGLLVRTLKAENREINQLFIPLQMRAKILDRFHDQSGHPGFFKTFSMLRDNAFWPGYEIETRNYVRSCKTCQLNPWSSEKSNLIPLKATFPFQLMEWDIIGPFNRTDNLNRYILCCVDLFTKFAIAIPLADLRAETICDKLIQEILCKFGKPRRIHSDNGRNFVSNIIVQICRDLNIELSHTTPYHPQGNGAVERFNRTLKHMLLKLDEPNLWDIHLQMLVNHYNNHTNESTGFSPFQLIYGKKPNFALTPILPNDNMNNSPTTLSYLKNLKRELSRTHAIALKSLTNSSSKNSRNYNNASPPKPIQVQSSVVYKNPATNKWSGPYVVLKRHGPSTYTISIDNLPTTVHRNNIKSYMSRSSQGGNVTDDTRQPDLD